MKTYLISIIIFLFAVTSAQAQYKIIVNKGNSTTSVSRTDLSNYFLKKRTKWSDGTKVVPVDLSSKSTIRESFSKNIHKKTTAQVRAYWQQSVFSGKATPPREMGADEKVIAFVKTHKGAIAYVSESANTNGVNVVTVK